MCVCASYEQNVQGERRVEDQQDSIYPLCTPFARTGETLTERKQKQQWKCSSVD